VTPEISPSTSAAAAEPDRWQPGTVLSLRTVDYVGSLLVGRQDAHLFLTAGKYRAASAVERLYSEVTADLYYSAVPDTLAPAIQSVEVASAGGQVQFTVAAVDLPLGGDVTRVVVTYTDGAGTWRSTELARNGVGAWVGSVPAGVEAVVQAVDGARNVAPDDDGGGYYRW
jgi:hypothetical protein